MIGILVEDLQNKLIAFIAKLSKIIFSPLMSSRLILENIEDKDIHELMSVELFKYNIDRHVNEIRTITATDKVRIKHSLQLVYTNAYITLSKTNYDSVKYNVVYTICKDILKLLSTIKEYKSYNGITHKNLDSAIQSLQDRYHQVKYDNSNTEKVTESIFSIVPYMKLSLEIKELVYSIQSASELLDNTISKSLAEQTVSLIKLYKDYEDLDSRNEIERQLTLIDNFLKEQIELNELPGSKKYVNNKLGISSHYIQSVIDNNNWVE